MRTASTCLERNVKNVVSRIVACLVHSVWKQYLGCGFSPAEMVIKVEVNGGMAAASVREAYDGLTDNPSMAWNRACTTRTSGHFRKEHVSPSTPGCFQNNPIDRVLRLQFSENPKPENFFQGRVGAFTCSLPTSSAQRWKHAHCTAILTLSAKQTALRK